MDLIVLVLLCALIGFVIYIVTTRVPMPPGWANVIQVVSLILLVLYVISRLVGGGIPNMLSR